MSSDWETFEMICEKLIAAYVRDLEEKILSGEFGLTKPVKEKPE